MEHYFNMELTDDQLRSISSIGLAHMGDAVFEVLVRSWLCANGKATGKGLHQATIRLVCAESQAEKAERILPLLTEEENGAFRRGRNAGHGQHPKGATVGEYRNATGMEALFGYLHMMKNEARITELFEIAYPKEAENADQV